MLCCHKLHAAFERSIEHDLTFRALDLEKWLLGKWRVHDLCTHGAEITNHAMHNWTTSVDDAKVIARVIV
jgi:hypothetical protein